MLTSILFLLLGSEFLAISVLIIYVGAISILFLFVVMMLNLRILELYSSFYHYVPVGGFIGVFFVLLFFLVLGSDFGVLTFSSPANDEFFRLSKYIFFIGNMSYIGYVVYNFFSYFVIIASFILLIAMIGTIVLTVDHSHKITNEKQNYENVVIPAKRVKY